MELLYYQTLLIILKLMVEPKLLKFLRSYVGKNLKQWELILPQIKFSYNRSIHKTIGKSPF